MSQKTRNLLGWSLTAILSMVFFASAAMKFTGGEDAIRSYGAIGLSAATVRLIGVVELLSIALFIIPRTGLLGTLLLAAYLGGAIATHLEHQQPVIVPVIVQCVVWITATIRFPELSTRIRTAGSAQQHSPALR
ncbi:DoxX family protein [Segetibacter sp. 3557_3]|uniref:DoxX family protein n=1 Tax=Segetibacter sp. 3557_3 TaxID=2547429 RepID=UPI001058E735|nr:DoxX family protein [Segetibacter sp. 3557_3]TDH21655.1 DoxX family protein [Segetibacter sp. 3557_3]